MCCVREGQLAARSAIDDRSLSAACRSQPQVAQVLHAWHEQASLDERAEHKAPAAVSLLQDMHAVPRLVASLDTMTSQTKLLTGKQPEFSCNWLILAF